MIQVASELKPRLVLPIFFDSGANSGILTKKDDHPGEPTFHMDLYGINHYQW